MHHKGLEDPSWSTGRVRPVHLVGFDGNVPRRVDHREPLRTITETDR